MIFNWFQSDNDNLETWNVAQKWVTMQYYLNYFQSLCFFNWSWYLKHTLPQLFKRSPLLLYLYFFYTKNKKSEINNWVTIKISLKFSSTLYHYLFTTTLWEYWQHLLCKLCFDTFAQILYNLIFSDYLGKRREIACAIVFWCIVLLSYRI